jgi:hypothetical protein
MLSFLELLALLLTLSAAYRGMRAIDAHGSTVGRVASLPLRSRGTSFGRQRP